MVLADLILPIFVVYGEWVNLTIVSAWHYELNVNVANSQLGVLRYSFYSALIWPLGTMYHNEGFVMKPPDS